MSVLFTSLLKCKYKCKRRSISLVSPRHLAVAAGGEEGGGAATVWTHRHGEGRLAEARVEGGARLAGGLERLERLVRLVRLVGDRED